ncbi:hypothetical protein GCM10025768_10970 [Microbacterium pseudoresistens]|uniref:Putative anti-sigma-YlaC factor YlaD n=1 Tax=Microbacterium pseudoresistens TaxID=640634 RepID=A0A7Y9JN60_9MICO|nr:hypothetical protein [Microbacterium pseudoresistens]NYD55000.1 putative anti-sigma-YlaC factor YlaD [Microbacterium pseudoresistens]
MRVSRLTTATAALLALEGIALLIVALVEGIRLGAGEAAELPTALALIGLTVIGGAGLLLLAVGVLRGRSWARSGGMVLQILGVATALSGMSAQPFPTLFVVGLGVPCALGIVLIFLLSRRAGLDARSASDAEADGRL